MVKQFFGIFALVCSLNLSAKALGRTIVIENPASRGVYLAYSVETADELFTEGYWHTLPDETDSLDVRSDGKLTLRLNFDSEVSNPLYLPGTKRCGSLTEKFKSIERKTGSPQVILYTGEGELEGYAVKKEGKDCAEAGGVLLEGFHEAVSCHTSVSGEVCFPYSIVDNSPSDSMYVNACNKSKFSSLYFSMRFFENNEWRSEGWYEVKKDKCRKVGPFPSTKPVYAVATTSGYEANYQEWTPEGTKVDACINPSVGFLYAEMADGTCEARDIMPTDAPAAEKTTYGQLVGSGFRGVADFNVYR